MHKLLFLVFLLGGLLAQGVALADHGEEAEVEAVEQAESITLSDLGVQDTGILPTSPFYFFKEWGRSVQSFFTFNRVSKAELEVKFSNEKAAELKIVEEQKSEDAEAIAKALENYRKAQERLTQRLERLRETSENPNVDRLLSEVAEKSLLHEKLLEGLTERHEEKLEVTAKAKEAKALIEGVVEKVAEKDAPEKFAVRLKEAFVQTPGSAFKHVRSLDFIDRITEKLPEEKRVKLHDVREEFAENLKDRIEDFEGEAESLKDIFLSIPGDVVRRSVLLEEIRVKAPERLEGVFEGIREGLERHLENQKDAKERAAERIEEATERVSKLERKAGENPELKAPIAPLLAQANEHITRAKAAFEEAKYGEAFGQARSAEVLARNGLRILETERELEELKEEELEEKEDAQEEAAEMIEEAQEKVQTLTRLAAGLREGSEAVAKLRSIIQEAQDYLAGATMFFKEGNFREAWHAARQAFVVAKHGFQLFEGVRHLEEQDREKAEEFGEDFLERIRERIRIVPIEESLRKLEFKTGLVTCCLEGGTCARQSAKNCEAAGGSTVDANSCNPNPCKGATSVICTQEFAPVCGVDGRTYSNRCVAEQQNRVRVASEGECGETRLPPETIRDSQPQQQPSTQEQDSQQSQLELQLQEQFQQLEQLQQQLQDAESGN